MRITKLRITYLHVKLLGIESMKAFRQGLVIATPRVEPRILMSRRSNAAEKSIGMRRSSESSDGLVYVP